MDTRIIRDYLISDTEVKNIVNDNIFYRKKPFEKKVDDYIIFNLKPLDGGVIKTYQLEIRLFSKSDLKLMKLSEITIKKLDWTNQKNINKFSNIIFDSRLLNGGGTIEDDNGVIETLLFFMLKIQE